MMKRTCVVNCKGRNRLVDPRHHIEGRAEGQTFFLEIHQSSLPRRFRFVVVVVAIVVIVIAEEVFGVSIRQIELSFASVGRVRRRPRSCCQRRRHSVDSYSLYGSVGPESPSKAESLTNPRCPESLRLIADLLLKSSSHSYSGVRGRRGYNTPVVSIQFQSSEKQARIESEMF